jgi:competence protein ComEA
MRQIKKSLIFILTVLLLVSFCQPVMASKGKININTASQKELVTLNGVGEKIAERIIEYRKDHPFKTIEELMNVKGIGQKLFEKNRDLISVKDEN